MHPYFIAFTTILRKECIRFMRTWTQTLLPSLITTILYFAIFGHVLGSQLGTIEGVSYMQYIAPGLVMMAVITNTYTNTVFSVFVMRFSKSIEEILVAPMPHYVMLLGFIAASMVRGLLVALLVIIAALFFTHLTIHNIFITLSVILLSALLFSLAGFVNALYAKKFDDTAFIPTFVLTPLNYLGGIFYPIALLPSFWHALSLCNPILYIVNAFRYGIIGITDINIKVAFVILLICSIALFTFNLHLLRKGKGLRT